MNLYEQSVLAKKAVPQLRGLDAETRRNILYCFADRLLECTDAILSANELDIATGRESGIRESMIDRLRLDRKRIEGIAEGVRQVASLPDPLNRVLEERTIASGIHLKKVTVPVGVIGIIYESRPNVTADCAALCIMSGNACVLKGGKEAWNSSNAIAECMKYALKQYNVSEDLVMLAGRVSHEETAEFMNDRENIDLLIPRGSSRLIRAVVDNARVPVIETGAGICHTYVEASADPDMAERILVNAKCSRPSVCNAMETMLIEKACAEQFLPRIVHTMRENGVTMYGDEYACSICEEIRPAEADSFDTEYNDLILNVGIVDGLEEAIAHIEKHGTHHSDAILTEDAEHAERFLNSVDSACVYHNASTRFTDGFEFGLGAEIGISTQKLHARGPMGLQELTTYSYKLEGKGEIR